jgi:hypothetical protein
MNKSEILSAFNTHLLEFLNDIITIFPNNSDIQVTYTSLNAMKKANPKLIVSVWKEHIADNYKNEIVKGNIDFFLNKDYASDVGDAENAKYILEKINILREPIKKLGEDNLNKTIKYIQNLTKISELYYS